MASLAAMMEVEIGKCKKRMMSQPIFYLFYFKNLPVTQSHTPHTHHTYHTDDGNQCYIKFSVLIRSKHRNQIIMEIVLTSWLTPYISNFSYSVFFSSEYMYVERVLRGRKFRNTCSFHFYRVFPVWIWRRWHANFWFFRLKCVLVGN
jgi:hypothetical protein